MKSMFARLILALTLTWFTVGTGPQGFAQQLSAADQSLILALDRNDPAVISAAIAQGANPNAQFDFGLGGYSFSALELSVVLNAGGARDALLTAGADPLAKDAAALTTAITMIDAASVHAFIAAIPGKALPATALTALCDRMSKVNADETRATVRQVVQTGVFKPNQDNRKFFFGRPTPAYSENDPIVEIAKELISRGADLNAAPSGRSPLQIAVADGDVFLALTLSAAGAAYDPRYTLNADLLYTGSAAGNVAGVEALLGQGMKGNTPNHDGRLPLPAAVASGRASMVESLLKAGANPDDAGIDQHSALFFAAQAKVMASLQALLDQGADATAIDQLGGWPMREAIRVAWVEGIQTLADAGADINQIDAAGRSPLHDIQVDELSRAANKEYKKLDESYNQLPSVLKALSFNFDVTDNKGRSIVGSIVSSPAQQNIHFITNLLASGAPARSDTLQIAAQRRGTELLKALIATGLDPNVVLAGRTLLENVISNGADSLTFLLLLNAGAALPRSVDDQNALALSAVDSNDLALLQLLIQRRSSLSSGRAGTDALERAIRDGNAAIVRILIEAQVDKYALDDEGNTRLHRFLRDRLERKEGTVDDAHISAVAALIEANYDLSQKNHRGQTAEAIAALDPNLRASFATILAQATRPSLPMHRAAYDNDEKEVASLLDKGEPIDAKDALDRTALTLALQLHRKAIARTLLRRGAEFTLEPRNGYQVADVSYIDDGQLASAFATRMLSHQILDTWPAGRDDSPAKSLARFRANRQFQVPDTVWNIRCFFCGKGGTTLKGNQEYRVLPVRSERRDTDNHTWFRLQQANIFPLQYHMPGNPQPFMDETFIVSGLMQIPMCNFDFSTDATCYPEVTIHNTDPPDGTIKFHTLYYGDVSLPTLAVLVTQGDNAFQIDPGDKLTFDRSAGQIDVALSAGRTPVFSLQLSVDVGHGPETGAATGFDVKSRLTLYAKIDVLKNRLRRILDGTEAAPIGRSKTLASAIRALTAEAIEAKFGDVVRELLKQKVKEVIRMDVRIRDLRDVIIANAALDSAQIDLWLDKLRQLESTVDADQQPAIRAMVASLEQLKEQAIAEGRAVKVLKDNFFTDADAVLMEYQALILELGQFVSVGEIEQVAPSAVDRDAIARKIKLSDILIGDGAMGGHGHEVRQLFGLQALAGP
ncbi:ankyrin repeat domain-containing protein [Sinorhizobium fredii]|uniref:ankyrin repeat domain-containing protein n=1 Tax=Rhizobium fredii TaxID=380 RepID=UPI003510F0E7